MDTSSLPPSRSAPPPPLPRRNRFRWLFRLLLGGSLLVNLITCARLSDGNRLTGASEHPDVTRTLAYGSLVGEAEVAIIELSGTIMRDAPASLFGETVDPVTRILLEIQAATVDEDVRAILLEINSPGGGVTASDEIYNALTEFKAAADGRFIVAHVKDMAASGGYYAALAADRIVAQPTSIVGSVGVMLSAVNLHELSEKIGIRDASLTSSENKALLNPLEPVDPEHNAILQSVVDSLYVRFRDLVLENRPFDEEFAAEHALLDGRVFTAQEAVDLGLVDVIGYDDTARKLVKELLNVEQAGFHTFEYTGGWAGLFGAQSPSIPSLSSMTTARFLYLWTP